MLAAALAQTPHVVAGDGRAYEDCDQEMLLAPRHDKPAVEPAQRRPVVPSPNPTPRGALCRARILLLAIESWAGGE